MCEFSSTMSAEVWCMEKKTTHVQKFYPGYVCLKIKAGDLMVVRGAHSNTTKSLLSYIHYKMHHNLHSVQLNISLKCCRYYEFVQAC